ncbi:MAG: hypothetical protein ACKO4Q_00085, partial [Planctomycetota bacterium]
MTHRTPALVRWLIALVVLALLAGAVQAQSAEPAVFGPVSAAVEAGFDVQRDLTGGLATGGAPLAEGRLSTAVEIAVLLTVLSLLPAILITVTSFTRIVIVMSFVRRALSTNELPPNPVIIGLSLFL